MSPLIVTIYGVIEDLLTVLIQSNGINFEALPAPALIPWRSLEGPLGASRAALSTPYDPMPG